LKFILPLLRRVRFFINKRLLALKQRKRAATKEKLGILGN